MTLKVSPLNILANSDHYPKILYEYNKEFLEKGKVNNKKFYEEVIKPCLPTYHIQTWYGFLKRFKTSRGIVVIEKVNISHNLLSNNEDQEKNLEKNLLSNSQATQEGIKAALNSGAMFYKQLWERYNRDRNSLTVFEQGCLKDAMFKAMKSQDSRIHAVGKIREDTREQALFDRAFSDASYSDE